MTLFLPYRSRFSHTQGPANIYNVHNPGHPYYLTPLCVYQVHPHMLKAIPLSSGHWSLASLIGDRPLVERAWQLKPGWSLANEIVEPYSLSSTLCQGYQLSYSPNAWLPAGRAVQLSGFAVEKKGKARIRSSFFPSFTCNWLDFIFVQQGKDGRKKWKGIEWERERECGFPTSLECGFLVASDSVYTPRRKAATEKFTSSLSSTVPESKLQRNSSHPGSWHAALLNPPPPFPTLINNTCWF